MPDKWIYMALNIGTVAVPFIASFYPKHPFYKHWWSFLKACIPVAIFFILWDIGFTHMGIWGFNPEYLSGIYISNLPLEEVLFFFCIPFSCTFTYFALQYFFGKHTTPNWLFHLTALVGVVCLGIALWHYNHWYTGTTFALCGLLLLWVGTQLRPQHWNIFVITYLLILLPFYAVNGVLTGLFIPEQVVWYNDYHNLGSRIFTIPLDDHAYSLVLQSAVVLLFEHFRKKEANSGSTVV